MTQRSDRTLVAAIILVWLVLFGCTVFAWTPGTGSPTAIQNFSVDTTNRTDVLAFYNTVYFASEGYASDMAWTGNIANDVPGTTSLTFQNDTLRRLNFYRALVGRSTTITFDNSNNLKDQQAALMFSFNGKISHTPNDATLESNPQSDPDAFYDYTADAATAASHSNIAIGYYGPQAIDAYMVELGTNNTEVGHRRWMLYSMASVMGTGDVPPSGTSYEGANALWFDGTQINGSTPAQFNKWPNAGYCPFPLVAPPDGSLPRWSVSCPGADFTNATVTMSQGGTNIPCTIIYKDNLQTPGSGSDHFLGDDTIVWQPSVFPTTLSGDTTYTVTISGIVNDGANDGGTITYNVTLFDPNVLGQSVAITGSATPPTSGSTYTFNAIDQADAYDLQVSTGSTAAWTEGAEASPTPQVTASTTGSYSIFQTAVKRTGAKAFQLAFPGDVDSSGYFSSQSFEITRQLVPSSTSQLQFYDLCRFVTNNSTLSAQVSADNGLSWTQVWSRAGTVPSSGGSSANWDPSFIANNVSLSSYAGKIILVRFFLNSNQGQIFPGTNSNYGFFLDDITVTNATQLTNMVDTSLSNTATSFALNSTTAGAGLQAGVNYYLRVRPEVGLTWYGFGNFKLVTPQASAVSGYSSWISSQYPSVTGGVSGCDSGDGIPNGLKYAFGLDPTIHNLASVIPAPQISGSNLVISYAGTAPGVTYGAAYSTDLVTWTAIADSGSGGNHLFSVSRSGQPHVFMRNQITIAP